MVKLYCKLLKVGKATYYRYINDKQPIIALLDYFTKDELEELNDTSKIKKLDLIKDYSHETIELGIKYYLLSEIEKSQAKESGTIEIDCNTLETVVLKQVRSEENINDIKKLLNSILEEMKESKSQ